MALKRTSSDGVTPRVLTLVPTQHSIAESDERPTSTREPADLRAQLDAALEEIAFLREQLRSAEAWSAHRVETLRARHRVAREIFVRDLARLMEGLRQHVRVLDVVEDSERPPTLDVAASQDAERIESGR